MAFAPHRRSTLQGAAPRFETHLRRLYPPDVAAATLPRLLRLLDEFLGGDGASRAPERTLFDETDVVLIAYGDQVREEGVAPLATLRDFLTEHVGDVLTGVHLLPHHPSTSDDGFAVSDYARVDPGLGDWAHVSQLGSRFRLMLDAVVNHTSASHPWFLGWRHGDPRYRDFYLEVDPDTDLASVTRPRTSPLLTPFASGDGQRWVWTTFSEDQVDLNYANPEVLLAVTAVLLDYLARGADILRLDAVAFLWKEPGTTCIHLPRTHEIVRFWRSVVDTVAPGTLLITETNVPQPENLAYFGDGTDEAHLVYQFPLPPLTLQAFASGDGRRLRDWLGEQHPPTATTTFFNFLGSHDGIGLRPVEGLLPPDEIAAMCRAIERGGGRVSYRAHGDGTASPYELNSVYYDALNGGRAGESEDHGIARFLSAHAILLGLAGVPAVYFHGLFGSRNWTEGADHTGRARVINRQRFARHVLDAELADPRGRRARILRGLRARIAARTRQPAFHPAGAQLFMPGEPHQLSFQRVAPDGTSTVLCAHEIAGTPGRARLRAPDRLGAGTELVDLVDGTRYRAEADGTVDVELPAFGVRWLRPR